VLLAGAVLLAVLLAGESSRAMLASARVSCSDSSRDVAMATNFGQNWRIDLHSAPWHFETILQKTASTIISTITEPIFINVSALVDVCMGIT